MSHKGVETIIGKLVTDECFRHRLFAEPAAAIDARLQKLDFRSA